jgi:hypothetical protein
MSRKREPEDWEYLQYQVCKNCLRTLPLIGFHITSKKSGTIKSHRIVCKDCAAERAAILVAYKIDFIKDFKMNNPCMDCGKFYHYYAMDFDHVRGQKVRDISDMWGAPIEKIKEEIAKCDLVCATCHRLRTWKRKEFLPKGTVRRSVENDTF